mmetsp:Transcript_1948/g.6813  ORF Transcript_1948/g.6813 Transcript_1948/m.6813 type:complete len:276 (+) Transcript_1948:195-1022(+)|eukprot:CAMPEP_0183792862 /NCGR_PEP_ID=MMETSP0803_2-20130417/2849_1 /TAXON_ID=195967 /ORGANISM="Crustomastix stigmata, Strain CCMP3273" /LENGTH=275 /DNA_ID=CAMNT_0026037231 /DNA_START=185 /DNA_END=1012 /DNA_ORIENTATION=+
MAVMARTAAPARVARCSRRSSRRSTPAVCRASLKPEGGLLKQLQQGAATAAASLAVASAVALAPPALPALATELDVLSEPVPQGYIIDDGSLLSRATVRSLNGSLSKLEKQSGYKVIVVTLRKLQFQTDPFAFADKVIETWYPTAELGNKKAVFVIVKTTKEAALVGGPAFGKALGDDVLESIITENVPTLTENDKFNEAITSSLDRVQKVLLGQKDPGPPGKFVAKKGSNFKTKEETTSKRPIYTTIVGGLLVISFVVPMIQYYGYVAGGEEET